jgi:hypothetical protein
LWILRRDFFATQEGYCREDRNVELVIEPGPAPNTARSPGSAEWALTGVVHGFDLAQYFPATWFFFAVRECALQLYESFKLGFSEPEFLHKADIVICLTRVFENLDRALHVNGFPSPPVTASPFASQSSRSLALATFPAASAAGSIARSRRKTQHSARSFQVR